MVIVSDGWREVLARRLGLPPNLVFVNPGTMERMCAAALLRLDRPALLKGGVATAGTGALPAGRVTDAFISSICVISVKPRKVGRTDAQ